MSARSSDVQKLVAEGYGVSKLRSLGFSPAEIKAAGFTLSEMHVHLGIHRLIEAGFTLEDFQRENFPIQEIVQHFSLEEILQSNNRAYSLKELFPYVPPTLLRSIALFTASEFLQLGTISSSDLRQYGFTEEEIIEALSSTSTRNLPVPGPYQPPHATSMKVGDSWSEERTDAASTFLKVTYRRLSQAESQSLLQHPYSDTHRYSSYIYEGSGKHCPRCGRLFVLLDKYSSSDGMCGVERGHWICDDSSCGMEKSESYEGYGTIF